MGTPILGGGTDRSLKEGGENLAGTSISPEFPRERQPLLRVWHLVICVGVPSTEHSSRQPIRDSRRSRNV